MNEMRFIRLVDVMVCCISRQNYGVVSGTGDSKLEAFIDLVRECWKYGKMMELLKVRRIKGI